MKKIKKLVAFLLMLCVVASGMLETTFASNAANESKVTQLTKTYVNPLYKDVVDEADLKQESSNSGVMLAEDEAEYYLSIEGAAACMREGLVQRQETIEVGIVVDAYYDSLAEEISYTAMAHTGVPTEGDYLLWQFAGWNCSISYFTMDNQDYVTFTYTMSYYTTAEQEAELTQEIDATLEALNIDEKDDYQKVKGIYDYICANVVYDYDNLEDDTYDLKYTAYAAMMNKTAVCQGYALLFYRMALEVGVDSRLISGIGNGGAHGWNIALVDGQYYNLDSTWDAGYEEYWYFLKCNENFEDHDRDEEYETEEFNQAYPMGAEDYVYNPEENPFVDVEETEYYYDAVLWAYENGITSGKDETHFEPYANCTRAQVVTFLWRAKGCPTPETAENPFVDVAETEYYYDAVLWAYENGITSGKDATHFQPDTTVTRSQFVTFLWRAEGEPNPTIENPFEDVSDDMYYTDAVLWAYENEITLGKDATHFQPDASCIRAQVVTFLYRAYN